MFLHNVMTVPNDAVMMVLLRRIKPKIEFLFSSGAGASICVDIGLKGPIVSHIMTKKFNVDLIVVVRVIICIRQLKFLAATN